MLVLTRKRDQSIVVGNDIEITVVEIKGDQVKLGIRAPANVSIYRKEVFVAIERENREAATQGRTADLEAARQALLRSQTPPSPMPES